MSDTYVNELLAHIANLENRVDDLLEENAVLYRENQSYRMWMNKSITRLQEMQK